MSNLLKRGTTTISEERIIDYNELIKLKLKNIANDRENHGNVDADGFVNGLKADVVEQLLTGSDEDGETAQSQEDVNNQIAAALEEANEQAQTIRDEANEVLAQAHMEARKIIEDAKRTGYEQGAQNAREEYNAKADELARDYEAKKAQLEKEYNDMKASMEPELVETITEVFKKITYTVAEDNKDIIIGLINGVMKNTDISNEFIIKVSPEDYKFLVNNQGKIYCSVSKEVTMDIVEDATMKKNQCIIESDTGVYDCSLDIELNNLIEDIKKARGKQDNLHVVEIGLESKLIKVQRREYFRLSCSIPATIRCMTVMNEGKDDFKDSDFSKEEIECTIIDISGGGIKAYSKQMFEKSSVVLLNFTLKFNNGNKEKSIIGKVVDSFKNANDESVFDNRFQFIDVSKSDRDEIVKYIFEQQRNILKKELGYNG